MDRRAGRRLVEAIGEALHSTAPAVLDALKRGLDFSREMLTTEPDTNWNRLTSLFKREVVATKKTSHRRKDGGTKSEIRRR